MFASSRDTSGRARQPDDRQMRMPAETLEFQVESSAGLAGDERAREVPPINLGLFRQSGENGVNSVAVT